MKALEFQKGNWVKRPQSVEDFFISPSIEDQIFAFHVNDTVSFSHPDDRDNNNVPIQMLRGIDLTEEWLTKFGFEDFSNDAQYAWKKTSDNLSFDLVKKRDENSNAPLSVVRGQQFIEVSYVHVLQNLYKELTGQLLE